MKRKDADHLIQDLRRSSPFRRQNIAAGRFAKKSTPAHIENPVRYTSDLIESLLQKTNNYLRASDIQTLIQAFEFARKAHEGQMRNNGLPYITHPIAVCEICAGWKLDINALLAALLHDVIEDQDVSKEEISARFNPDIAELVDGLTKLDKLQFSSKAEQQAESFRKMLLAMARDIRVILVKLADRLHNMRTLDGVGLEKARRVSKETKEIYAPIADRLGLNSLYREFNDLCFQGMYPYRYEVLSKALMHAKGNRRDVLSTILDSVRSALPAQGIEADVQAREKSLASIYKKMKGKRKSFSEIMDIHGFRIVVNTQAECYLVLGILHQLYRPVPGKFKDYIALPKLNGYQSLHTTLIGPYGISIEFQIRTRNMQQMSENGVISHWMYKNKTDLSDIQQQTHRWMESLLEIQNKTRDSAEFLEHVKIDLFPDAVFVLTPKGRVVSLPRKATPIDFAYAIHTDIGNHIKSVRINHKAASINTPLRSGDTVEIITSPEAQPSADWIEFVRTGRARSEIRNYLRNHNYADSVSFGKKVLKQALDNLGIQMPADDDPFWHELVKSSDASSLEEIFLDIGLGNRLASVVARRFLTNDPLLATTAALLDEKDSRDKAPILIQGREGQSVQLAPCCMPIPGDAITAVLRPGHGLVVHCQDCPVAVRQKHREPERWVNVAWDDAPSKHLHTRIEVIVEKDRGVLGAIMMQIAAEDANIVHISTKDQDTNVHVVLLTLEVENRNHLARIIRRVRRIKAVYKVKRLKG
ncbi:RelA/SpoT family protein [Brackiella oedipodis]|uniref:RelA/SpoT family protein n=1 Tax=Brackiella oedipodis TaxID=124225 RepID=UPI00048FF0AB|nr:bifunctional (p)ppGpp synthetase/guanosine-3',5'-bis(diphosphate) 3'-pyrophosphohydrolase [Brackiella oedipodis]